MSFIIAFGKRLKERIKESVVAMQMRKLSIGDTIGIISPCIAVTEQYLEGRISTLKSKGFNVKYSKNLFKCTDGYAATAKERANDFNDMISDDEVKMIFFGGGDVCNELLPLLDFDNIKKHPKIICSFSDSTTLLNVIYANTGLITYYGQSPRTFEELTEYNYRQFEKTFITDSNFELEKNSEWKTINSGSCEGTLIGGYVENFALLLGGKYFPYNKSQKYVLFLEDHEKFNDPARFSAYLSHIEQSGFMSQVGGLIFGHYSINEHTDLINRLNRFGMDNRIPVITCDDFGHGTNNAILPIGCNAVLDSDKKKLKFSYLH